MSPAMGFLMGACIGNVPATIPVGAALAVVNGAWQVEEWISGYS